MRQLTKYNKGEFHVFNIEVNKYTINFKLYDA